MNGDEDPASPAERDVRVVARRMAQVRLVPTRYLLARNSLRAARAFRIAVVESASALNPLESRAKIDSLSAGSHAQRFVV